MKFTSKALMIVTIITLMFAACKKNSSGTTTNNTSSTDCDACTYIPTCVGISYTYQDSSSAGSTTPLIVSYTAEKDTTIAGAVYRAITQNSGNGYYNCNNGVTTSIAYNLVSVSGNITLQSVKLIPLKANAGLGATWEDSIYNPTAGGQWNYYNYTIADTGISRIVLGTTFTNVIHVASITSVVYPGYGSIVGAQSDNYYAKGVGLIESIQGDAYGDLLLHLSLKTYTIPN
jgi:hypothetical protein